MRKERQSLFHNRINMNNKAILCVSKNVWDLSVRFSNLSNDIERHGLLLNRDAIEYDEDFLQVIPYMVLRWDYKIYLYKRKGKEKRLDGKLSIGIGGHCESMDYKSEAQRELKEETGIQVDIGKPISILRTDDNVGKHHVGIMHVVDIDNLEYFKVSSETDWGNWVSPHYIDMCLNDNPDSFESWSRIVIEKVLFSI